MTTKSKYSFHADKLDQSILLTCPITGIVSQILMPALPIVLKWDHPLSHWHNAKEMISAIKSKGNWKDYEKQVLAGLALSLLREKEKLTGFPNSSATEANMLLQSCGIESLWELLTVIVARWDSEQTWLRVPKLSFTLTVYDQSHMQQFSTVISKYSRLIRKAITPEELDKGELGEIFLAFKENNAKLVKGKVINTREVKPKNLAYTDQNSLSGKRGKARELAKELSKQMPTLLAIMVTKSVGNLQMYGNEFRQDTATKIRTCGIGRDNSEQFNKLAFFFETNDQAIAEEDILGFSETVSPLPKELRSASDIIAEILAKLAAQA